MSAYLGMKTDDNCGRDEDALRVERASSSNVASIEGELDAGYWAASFVVTTIRLIEESLIEGKYSYSSYMFSTRYLDVNVSLKRILCDKADGDGRRSAFDFRIASYTVVDRDGKGSAEE